ncbi:MAG: ABC transporter permease [Pyrinomonadaceae bacterium MAG19_C2-C3]|nr:ABC transporter permease [Pyrinomonadaceae bacterium MAG19_C2-C3]
MNTLLQVLLEIQETFLLATRALVRIIRRPAYFAEILTQIDRIGVGSLSIILLTGFFTGGVLTLQTVPTLKSFGTQSVTGQLIALSLVRELGPVLSALMVTARVGSAISAELGAMSVSQQIDAMRALGTDPIRKLVAPRLIALLISLPLLTVLADIIGIMGGWIVAVSLFQQDSSTFLNSVRNGITGDDVIGGVIKPIVFGFLICAISCRQGLTTEGGTVGVGLSTTRAVVLSAIMVIISDFFLAKALQVVLNVPT